MKLCKNNKLAGRLLAASGMMFFITASMVHQPAFYGVGGALVAVGIAVGRRPV